MRSDHHRHADIPPVQYIMCTIPCADSSTPSREHCSTADQAHMQLPIFQCPPWLGPCAAARDILLSRMASCIHNMWFLIDTDSSNGTTASLHLESLTFVIPTYLPMYIAYHAVHG